ncbi:MAG: PHP domain-containing protein [Melioribacteraceae bacterium]|nr:PHP domain-containing protein [Melioribacteraceae bacterium]
MFEYVGAVHVHSVYSDGSGKIDEILNCASESGLDFVLLTDHNTLRPLEEGFEGWYGKTLLLIGCEINDKNNRNHYLAFGIDKTFSTRLPAKEYVKLVNDEGGIGFIAHPHEKRDSMKEHPPYPWTDWDVDGYTGIEIWNHMSEWMEGLTEENKYNRFMHPLKSIEKPPAETLEVWDKQSEKRKVVGIGGIDAHAHKMNVLGFFEVEVFPYKVLFKSIRTHILSETELVKNKKETALEDGKTIVYEALKEGRCFVSNHYHGDATGFRFTAYDGDKIYQMGDTVKLSDTLRFNVILPEKASVRIICNGKTSEIKDGKEVEFLVKEEAVYRVEVYKEKNAWIFSNHVRVV